MKTLVYSVIVATLVLTVCFLVTLFRSKRTKKDQKTTLLVLPVCILLLFIALFVGASVSRNHIKKELAVLKEENQSRRPIDDSRLKAIEERNREISWIIGEDEELEKWIESLCSHE